MIFAYIFLHEKLSLQGAIGAFLIMVGVVITASTYKSDYSSFLEICLFSIQE